MTNRLAQESSPYLLQHADNPVDWLPWSQQALELASTQDKPIFLSIGYAACHWCHVMAHESFEDEETAALLNEHFINIKVDREERPDIDSIYMDAVVAMTGSGGWPLSVFLTPEGEPFYGGTYFPPEPRHGMPSFRELLTRISQSWQQDREKIYETGQRLADHVKGGSSLPGGEAALDQTLLQAAAERLHSRYDWRHGGWGGAPKFPQTSAIEFLLHRYVRSQDRLARDMALHSLRSMASGGIYDHLGGGFARYSVDERWLVPHFEKMLYDNALLLSNYIQAWQISQDDDYLQVAEQTFTFLQDEMLLPSGGYASSLDADSEGVEGKYYVWDHSEIQELLDDEEIFSLFSGAYGLTEAGNFEGHNVLHRAKTDQELAKEFKLDTAKIQSRLLNARQLLLKVRQDRVRPAKDDKVLTAWNGFLLSALARGAQATAARRWSEAAQSLAVFLVETMIVDDRLKRSWRAGQARFNAYLEDYASLGLGLLELYALDFNPRWYAVAERMGEQILDHFTDPAGGFFDTSDDHEQLLTRPKSLQDSPTPSSNSLAVKLLQQLATLTGRKRYREPAEKTISMMGESIAQYPTAFAAWLSELAFALGPQIQLAVVGDPGQPGFKSLTEVAQRQLTPDLVMAGGPPSASPQPDLMNNRSLKDGRATAYLCQGFSCRLPVTDPQLLTKQLEEALEPA